MFHAEKTYDIENSVAPTKLVEKPVEEKKEEKLNNLLLFTTKTCPNCPIAKAILDKANIEYIPIFAEENKELSEKYQIKRVPTLLVPTANGIDKYIGASEIKHYIESVK